MTFLIVFNADGAPASREFDNSTAVRPGASKHVAFRGYSGVDAPTQAPVTLSGRLWFVGGVRLDARDQLCSALNVSHTASDALLCLYAYQQWGEKCVTHLLGDFGFAIWDDKRQLLFCARDHLGIKPLFHARHCEQWLLSDSLIAIRAADTRTDLDAAWVGDYLTISYCIDSERTVYRHINRLAPAHTLSISREATTLARYWELTVDKPIFYKNKTDYLDRFHELLELAIKDRLPPGRVGISMSGGLDSTALAAKTVQITRQPSRVIANTKYFESIIKDDEEIFSSQVAKRLGIEHTICKLDDLLYDEDWRTRDIVIPEPDMTIINAHPTRQIATEMAEQTGVWLYGEGPDNALTFEWRAYLGWLVKTGRWSHLGSGVFDYFLGKSLAEWRSTFASRNPFNPTAAAHQLVSFDWLNKNFDKENDFSARMKIAMGSPVVGHPWRPRAFASFRSSIWQNFLNGFDPHVSGVPIDWRHPFLDIRLLTYMLSVPPVPWGRRKGLLRTAMSGLLPDEVLRRDKTPIREDPLRKIMRANPFYQDSICLTMSEFVDIARIPSTQASSDETYDIIKIATLDYWLRQNGYS